MDKLIENTNRYGNEVKLTTHTHIEDYTEDCKEIHNYDYVPA